ncbi:pectin lyase-like superfamily protein [Artemisia annua]|uniref:Pectin lyase-like superfamily protein n=1 Tax=Artemisia annua TaxID=35608 RepID=A0A2U1MNH9_ARTAN|nr:pectin lyase-like superfamily protein [Artemisia annua]
MTNEGIWIMIGKIDAGLHLLMLAKEGESDQLGHHDIVFATMAGRILTFTRICSPILLLADFVVRDEIAHILAGQPLKDLSLELLHRRFKQEEVKIQAWENHEKRKADLEMKRMEALMFHKCNNLVIKNLIIMNGKKCEMTFTTCDGVKASRLSISAPASIANTDGIHISESTNVEVKEATVRTGDDCISIISNSSKVTVTRICGPAHGISIRSLGKAGTCDQVYDVSVHEAFLSNTEDGLRIKTWQGTGHNDERCSQRMCLEADASS